MINIDDLFDSIDRHLFGQQKKITVDSPLGVYYGISPDGYLRLSFLSKKPSPRLDSTRLLRVTQGKESSTVYWTCFDLLQHDAKNVYFTFCSNLIESVSETKNESSALKRLKERFVTWKTMFKKELGSTISYEKLQGLFGEMYFLKNYMVPRYGIETAIKSWSGPDSKSKDFAVTKEWFEIKTVGANSAVVHISSLAQLSSDYPGHLVILRIEGMSDEFDNGQSCVGDLFINLLDAIDDELLEGIFLNKLSAYGFDISDESFNSKFDVKSLNLYKVNDDFPRLTENSITREEICDVQYSLNINSLNKYLEEG